MKLGDKVRVTEDSISTHLIGKVGVIIQIDESSLPYEVDFKPGADFIEWFSEEELEMVEGENSGND